MKREILCIDCKPMIKGLSVSEGRIIDPYPGEHLKVIKGKAARLFTCDRCGKSIQIGEICLASSIWADYGGIPYRPWENEYLDSI